MTAVTGLASEPAGRAPEADRPSSPRLTRIPFPRTTTGRSRPPTIAVWTKPAGPHSR
jgi:hypothetical protein